MKMLRRKVANAEASYRALGVLLREGHSFRAQAIAGAVALFFAFVMRISTLELLIIILTIGAVLTTEALNTAIEEVCDHVTPEQHPQIGRIKDLASGASGIIGIAALIIGCIIFIPYFLLLV